jgi:hypothetical protein
VHSINAGSPHQDVIEAQCLTGVELQPRKGIDLADHPVILADFTLRDVQNDENAGIR